MLRGRRKIREEGGIIESFSLRLQGMEMEETGLKISATDPIVRQHLISRMITALSYEF